MDMDKVGTSAEGVCVVVTTLISPLIFSHKNQKAMCIVGVPNVHIRGKSGSLREGFVFGRHGIQDKLSQFN